MFRQTFGHSPRPAAKIGSKFVVAGSVPLAVGIAADVAVVFFKAIGSENGAIVAGLVSLFGLLGLWLGYPFWLRATTDSQASKA